MRHTRKPMFGLFTQLGAADWESRSAAAAQLRGLGGEAVEALIDGSMHGDWMVRAESVALMDHLADDRCAEALRRALKDPMVHVRRHAVHAVGCQPCKRRPLGLDSVGLLVERALADSSLQVRRAAVHQLGLQPRDDRAVDALEKLLRRERDEKLLRIARWALQQLS